MINNDKEIWKMFPLYCNYMVSNLGRVMSTEREVVHARFGKQHLKQKFLKPANSHGYKRIVLSIDGIKSSWLVHRIVAITFIQNPQNKPQINHKNGVKDDNRVENLEWCTHSENGFHSYRELGRKPSRGMTGKVGKVGALNPMSKTVRCTTLDIEFDSAMEAGRALGVDNSDISKICNGRKLHTNGLVFIYKKAV